MSKSPRLYAAVAASVLLIAACGGGGDGGDGGASGSTVAATTPETTDGSLVDGTATVTTNESATTTSEPAPSTTAAAATTTAAPTTTAPADDGSCLVGDWIVTQEQMNAYYAGLMSTLDAPLDITVAGSAPLSFRADGTYGWAPAFDLTVAVAGQSGTGVTSGAITGNWTAVDGVVTTASDVNALDLTITIGSTTVSGSDMANGLLNSSPVNGVTYSCAGPTPVLDFKTADPAVTVPVTLTPA